MCLVPSDELPSMTIYSISLYVCDSTVFMVSQTVAALLYVMVIIEIFMTAKVIQINAIYAIMSYKVYLNAFIVNHFRRYSLYLILKPIVVVAVNPPVETLPLCLL